MTASVLVKEAVETKIATAKELAHCFVDLIEAVLSWITIERYDKAAKLCAGREQSASTAAANAL